MEFRAMADMMSDTEVALVLRLVCPFSRVEQIDRNISSNSIKVQYSLLKESYSKWHEIDFLPDDIYLISDGESLEDNPMEEGDVLYKYRQFMTAKGYSEIWLNNPYIEI